MERCSWHPLAFRTGWFGGFLGHSLQRSGVHPVYRRLTLLWTLGTGFTWQRKKKELVWDGLRWKDMTRECEGWAACRKSRFRSGWSGSDCQWAQIPWALWAVPSAADGQKGSFPGGINQQLYWTLISLKTKAVYPLAAAWLWCFCARSWEGLTESERENEERSS